MSKVFNKFAYIFVFFILSFAFFNKIDNYCDFFVCAEINPISTAKSMIVLEKNSNRILYASNEHERLPMASLTKIITCFYVIEKSTSLQEKFKIPKAAVGIEGTSIGLKEGEVLCIEDLLYGLMLRSGNDAAVALSIYISGDQETFVNDVNAWLKELGFINTQIKNPHGLHAEGHFTTAYELGKFTAIALNNSTFKNIVSTKEKIIYDQQNLNVSRKLINKNRLLNEFDFSDGVKTGFTSKAGRCFVGSASKNNMQVICVLLNCVPMFEECKSLFEKAFNEFNCQTIVYKGEKLGNVGISKSKEKNIDVYAQNDYFYPLKNEEKEKIKKCFIAKEDLEAPVETGEELGVLEISLENQLIFTNKIYNIKYIESNTLKSKIKRIVDVL